MKWKFSIQLLLYGTLSVILLPNFCSGQEYDSTLMTPDIDVLGMNHGFNLTPLGCLLYTPLAYYETTGGYNVATYFKGKEVSSVGAPYSEVQKQIVFEFQRNGTLRYWLKKDYLVPAFDTSTGTNGQKYITHSIRNSSQLTLKKIYDSGVWKVNFADSTLLIDFGKNDLGLLPLKGNYTSLGAGRLSFQQTNHFDSLTNGKMRSYTRKINSYFESY